MRWQFRTQSKSRLSSRLSYTLYLKWGAISFLFLLSILIVACGSGTNTNLGQPPVTVTIDLGQSNGSPTPPLPEYTCSAWVTNTTPGVNTSSVIGVYAKFVHNVNGNPEGVYPASATATVLWPDGNVNVSSNTTPDGLAVFTVSTANRAADLNKIVLVTVSFTGPNGVPPCTVGMDQAAFFTLVIATAPVYGRHGSGSVLYIGHRYSPRWSITHWRFRSTNGYWHHHIYGDDNPIADCHRLWSTGRGPAEKDTNTLTNTMSLT